MAIGIYVFSIILLWIAGRRHGPQIRLKHAVYTSFLAASVSIPLKNILKKDVLGYGSQLMFLYGKKVHGDVYRIHWAVKISSFIIFAGFTIVYLSLASAGAIDFAISCLMPVLGFFLPDIDLKSKIKQKKSSILIDYPVFCTDLAVMNGAGLDLYEAWEMAAKRNSKNEFYKEARSVILKTSTGMLFRDALKDFSANLSMPEIHTFVTIVNQEIKSGSGGMASRLRDCAGRSWKIRESTAREKGEEAVSKLVFPLAVGFAGILLILAAPAVIIMKGM